ncbi:MAG: flagellar hook-associated protein FlgK [Halanaerobiales bacterium]|nr:flagellar hook-associated protein FlgK [Halanaerobiales bacterium]
MSTFGGLSIGLRALETQRKSLDVTGHNIANANNEDYNKQRAIHSTTYPHTRPGMNTGFSSGQMGTGVEVETIERVKDQFVNRQMMRENQTSAYWEELSQGLEKLEYIINEPSDSGISSSINQFWNSLQDLSNNPNNTAARNMVRENAKTMIDAFQSVDSQLKDYQTNLNQNLENVKEDINNTAERIADLNKQIISVKSTGQNPNDLLDKRDALFKELNRKINVQGREDGLGNLIITTDGRQIVNGSDHYELEVDPGDEENTAELIHSRTGDPIEPTNGQTKAMFDLRDDKIDLYREKLENLAGELVSEFNDRHRTGYDLEGNQAGNFFRDLENIAGGNKIAEMALSAEIKKEGGLARIAAGNYSNDPTVVGLSAVESTALGDYAVDIKENDSNADQWDITISDLEGNQLDSITINKEESIGFDSSLDTATADPDDIIGFVTADSGEFNLTPRDAGTAEIGLSQFSGSGDNASYLAAMFDSGEVVEGTSIEGYFRTIVSSAGAESKRSQEMENNQKAVLDQLKSLDRSVSGVSLDEEMANLIKYQQAYNSAAKYITKTDEILQTLINMI